MFQTIHFETINSTNSYLMKNGDSFSHLSAVSSTVQTDGRGRSGRSWLNSKNAMLFSILIKKDIPLKNIFLLNYLAPLSLAEFIYKLVPEIKIKFPNDLIIQNKKIAGILVETTIFNNKLKYAVLGYGINISSIPILEKEGVKPGFLRQYVENIPDLNKFIEEIRKNITCFLESENYTYKIISGYNKLLTQNIIYKFKFPNGESDYLKIKKINFDGKILVYNDKKNEFFLPEGSTYLSDCEVIE